MKRLNTTWMAAVAAGSILAALTGCVDSPAGEPGARSSGSSVKWTNTQFAADAAKRHPYKADAPRGGEAPARAQIGYAMNVIEVVNLSDENWEDVELWVNRRYVVHTPRMEKGVLKRFTFQMLYDENGNYLPISVRRERIQTLELYRNGKMYDLRAQLSD